MPMIMMAFDTNIVSEVLAGNMASLSRISAIPRQLQAVPVIVIEEMMRGKLNAIRQAEAGKAKISLPLAYDLFQELFESTRRMRLLAFTDAADQLFRKWRADGSRVSTHDLRITATCIAHNVTLVTRNRRDFERIPDLSVEFW